MSEQQCVFGGENQVLDSIAQVIRSRETSKVVRGKVLLGHSLSISSETLTSFTSNGMNSRCVVLQFRELAWFVPKNGFVLFSGITILNGPPGYKEEVRSTATVR
jgi:hypothetical protein